MGLAPSAHGSRRLCPLTVPATSWLYMHGILSPGAQLSRALESRHLTRAVLVQFPSFPKAQNVSSFLCSERINEACLPRVSLDQHKQVAGAFLVSRWTSGLFCPLGVAADGARAVVLHDHPLSSTPHCLPH
jgi:hypothetical protein